MHHGIGPPVDVERQQLFDEPDLGRKRVLPSKRKSEKAAQHRQIFGIEGVGPRAMGCAPNPLGIINAAGASPCFTAVSAPAAVYSGGTGSPFFALGWVLASSEGS